jgi:catechol 2,3-dioxygenase-like lactoylglutathione lyase family enzyme
MSALEPASTATATTATATVFEGVSPIFTVKNILASIEYYVRVLGFKVDWGGATSFASVSRGGCHIMLCEGDQGHAGTWVWIGVGDVGQLFEEYKTKGAKIRHRPTNYEWAYEMQVEDLDGNVLRCGSDPKESEPTGLWLDMYGAHWERLPDGGWKRLRAATK